MNINSIEPVATVPNQFFPLPGRSKSVNTAQNTGSVFAALLENNAGSLLQDVNQTSSQDNSLFGIADLIDLSPPAQSYLNWLNVNNGSSIVGSDGFILSAQQQDQISAIIAKYKDALFNIGTYNNIIRDLAAAGLSPDQLSVQDATRSVNLSQILLDALNGQNSTMDFLNFFNNPTEQANTNGYILQIITEWESISTQFNASSAVNTNAPLIG